jgi:polyphosphate kinase
MAKKRGHDRRTPDGSVAGMTRKEFERELAPLQLELVKMLDWIRQSGHRLVVLSEGRDAAGKGGTIKRVADPLNPRFCRVAALPAPTERERTQWYFQRYVAHLPALARSCCSTAPGTTAPASSACSPARASSSSSTGSRSATPSRSGASGRASTIAAAAGSSRHSTCTPARRWVDYSRAKDVMIEHTSTPESPWYEVDAREEIEHLKIELPARQEDPGYRRPAKESLNSIPTPY